MKGLTALMKSVAIIIPAYNEAPRIGAVLDVVCSYPREKRIVIIDDGSKDATYEAAKKYDVEKIIRHERNLGKGAALQTGINYIKDSPLWLFIDADLVNLKHHHLDQLLLPIEQDSKVGMTIGMLVSNKKNVNLAQKYFSILNGQRGLANSFVKNLPSLAWARFGVEVFLSKVAKLNNVPVAEPVLNDLTHYTKEEKYGFIYGFPYRLRMYKECLYAYFNWKKYI